MTTDQHTTPFSAEPAPRVPLTNPPLEKVIFQVRFPAILKIRNEHDVAPFQESLRHRYPTLRLHNEQTVKLTEDGVSAKQGSIWRLIDDDGGYTLSLAPDFLSVDVQRYETREQFIDRVTEAVGVLDDVFAPSQFDRIGVRYVDRVADDEFVTNLASYLRPEILGAALTFPTGEGVSLGEATAYSGEGFQTRARWGVVPPKFTPDPRIIAPAETTSWFLDVDTFTTNPGSFDLDTITQMANTCADADYGFFRWAVTDEFLRTFGGDA